MTDSEKIQAIQTKMQDILIVGGRPVKGTTKEQCYEALEYIQDLLRTNKRTLLEEENAILKKALELACIELCYDGNITDLSYREEYYIQQAEKELEEKKYESNINNHKI